jgi:hypothetical protein
LVANLTKKFRNCADAKEATHKNSVIARSEMTKQSILAVWGIATGLRPRNDNRILCQMKNPEKFWGLL